MASRVIFLSLLFAATSCAGEPSAGPMLPQKIGPIAPAVANAAGTAARHSVAEVVAANDGFEAGQVPEFHFSPPH